MKWEQDLEQLLRNQMPYAFSVNGAKGVCQEGEFSEALGYVLENVRIQMKKAFVKGFEEGQQDSANVIKSIKDQLLNLDTIAYDPKASTHFSEKAWLEWEER